MASHTECAADRGRGPAAGADEVFAMLHLRLRNPRIWSPIAAVLAQLLLTAAAAGSTGGGDFPRIRCLLAIL